MKRKVLAYITRSREGKREVLVFQHRDFPEAGIQVPAGTVKRREPVESALLREVAEESGLTGFETARKLAENADPERGVLRHIYHLEAPAGLPDAWSHTVIGDGEDSGLVFEYTWADCDMAAPLLGWQGAWIDRIS